MQMGKDQPKSTVSRTRRRRQYQPTLQGLERRELLAIDLVNVAGGAGSPGPYGVLEVGINQAGGLGWSSALVGDVNGDGFQDFVVGAPTIDVFGPVPIVGTGASARAYLVFGSASVNQGNVDWLTLVANDRIGDMGTLGNGNQNNPVTGTSGFAYNGLAFFTGNTPASKLGSSVAAAGDVNNDGFADFLLGAPGATDALGLNAGTGRAYLVYGGQSLATRQNKQVDLDAVNTFTDINVLTFTNLNQVNSQTGTAVAGVGDFISDGLPDIAIGAPNGTATGLANQGVVYVISNQALRPARTATIALNTVGQTGGIAGFQLVGGSSGDEAGFSIAGAGNTAGRNAIGGGIPNDLLIGAPDRTPAGNVTGTGSAFLIYANSPGNLGNLTTTVNNVSVIPLGQVGLTVPGAQFNGALLGDATGFSVSPAGDFNNDGNADFLIGSPFWDNAGGGLNAGRSNLIFGNSINSASGPIFGVFDLSTLPNEVVGAQFNGVGPNAWAGWSNTLVGQINTDTLSEIAIGSPGVNGGSGQVYLIPGNPDLIGTFSLGNTESLPVQGLIITLGNFPGQPAGPTYLGTSVSGRLGSTTANSTIDRDTRGDLIVGAAGLGLNSARNLAGGVFGLEGAFLPLPTPVPTFISVTIGVDSPFPPFTVNATTPDDLAIYVFSNATVQPTFNPVTDINPATTVVNGVAFPNAVLTAAGQDYNNDGIPDAILTISPRSALGLTTTTTTFTLNGQTLSTVPGGVRRYEGSATITVTGGGGGGGGAPAVRNLRSLFDTNSAVGPFGSRFVPNPAIVYKFQWQRNVPTQVTWQQFNPDAYFAGRYRRFYHGADPGRPNGSQNKDSASGIQTLGQRVFTRGQYPNGFYDARRSFIKR